MALGCIFVGGILGRHREGYEFGRFTLLLLEEYGNRRQRGEAFFAVGYFGTSWMRPAREAEQLFQIAHEASLDSVDLFHYGASATVMSRFMRGAPLEEVWAKSEEYAESLRRFSLHEYLGAIEAVRQEIRNLRGETITLASLASEDFDEPRFETQVCRYGGRHLTLYYFIVKMQVLYLRGQHDAAVPEGAEGCPDNFLHKERILQGEILRITGDPAAAFRAYEQAAEAAQRFGYLQVEALAHHLGARLYAGTGRQTEAAEKLERARDCYRRWGATHYVAALD